MSDKNLRHDKNGRFKKRIKKLSYEDLPKTKKLIERFLQHGNRNGGDFSLLTIQQYIFDFNLFFKWFKKEFTKITPEVSEDYKSYLMKQNISKVTVGRRLNTVQGLMRYAIDRGYSKREKNPIVVRVSKNEQKNTFKKVSKSILTRDEIQRILSATRNPRDNLIIALLYGTGMRVGELSKLNLSDVDLENREVYIQGKGNTDRLNRLKQCLMRRFNIYLMVRAGSKGPDAPFFTTKKGLRFTTCGIRMMVHKMVRRAGINKKITPHSFRHTHVTHSIEQGIPLPEIKNNVGHSSIETTMKYYQFAQSRKTYVDRFPSF